MYESSALDQKDQYEVFFGGNHSRIDITTPLDENKNLLIFKDSYANCLIPFLQPYFRSIIVIDPRYYYDDIDSLITDNSITDILFLYNVDTFMTDTSLADVLAPSAEETPASPWQRTFRTRRARRRYSFRGGRRFVAEGSGILILLYRKCEKPPFHPLDFQAAFLGT